MGGPTGVIWHDCTDIPTSPELVVFQAGSAVHPGQYIEIMSVPYFHSFISGHNYSVGSVQQWCYMPSPSPNNPDAERVDYKCCPEHAVQWDVSKVSSCPICTLVRVKNRITNSGILELFRLIQDFGDSLEQETFSALPGKTKLSASLLFDWAEKVAIEFGFCLSFLSYHTDSEYSPVEGVPGSEVSR